MASVLGLKGFVKSAGAATLIAAYENDFVNLATGTGYSQNIDTTKDVEFEVFLDSLFWQNYTDTPTSFDGTNWTRTHCAKLPLSKYIKVYQDRLYLAYVKIGSDEFPSRIWYSDLPKNNTIQWGYEQGTNLATTAGNPLVRSANAGFDAFNIKVGDPFFITSGSDAGEFVVEKVNADQQITLTASPKNTAASISFWVGGNYLDVRRDDNDYITGLGENDDKLLIFKQDSLHRYDGTTLRRVKGALGTTSNRSIVNVKDMTIYFHGSFGTQTGFYMYDGISSKKISSAIENHIAGINIGKYTSVVAWAEGELYRAYVGDIDNDNYGISLDKVVLTYNTSLNTWSVDPIADGITARTTFRQAGEENIYLGTNDDEILKTPDGNDFNDSDIPWVIETRTYYPSSPEFLNTFKRIQVYSKDAGGVQVLYKLVNMPWDSDENWQGLGDIEADRTELPLPAIHNKASGIKFRFQGTDQQESTAVIKKLSIIFRKEDVRL